MAKNSIRIPFPYKGKDENWAMSGQPPLTSPDLKNVRPRDVQDKRSRGGQRPPVRKIMYWWDYPGGGADLGLPDPSPIIGMDQVTAVYYASIAGDDDSGAGDPSWDGIVVAVESDQTHELQLYSFDGVFDSEINMNIATVDEGGLNISPDGKIYVIINNDRRKYSSDGTLITESSTTGGAVGDFIVPSIKDDHRVFTYSGNYLYCYDIDDLLHTNYLWKKDMGQGASGGDLIQLENSNDILVAMGSDVSDCVKRVSRTDGTLVTDYTGMDKGAQSIAVDEANGWLYKVGGFDVGAQTKVYRCDLSDGGNITSYTIAGGNGKQVRLYGGKVYVVGARATDNNTVWKLDSGLVGIETDYDTGAEARDLRILAGGTVYVVGANGTNEDADTGNVNVLTSALAYIEGWNVRSGKDLLAIAWKL